MELVSRNAGAIEDDYDEVLEAGFSEGIDSSGFAIFFSVTSTPRHGLKTLTIQTIPRIAIA